MGEKEDEKKDDEGSVKFGDLRNVVKEVVQEALGALETTKDKVHDKSQEKVENRLDRGTTIQQEVQAELAKMREEEEKSKKEAEDVDWRKSVDEKLAEKAPVQRSRRHRFMGWGE